MPARNSQAARRVSEKFEEGDAVANVRMNQPTNAGGRTWTGKLSPWAGMAVLAGILLAGAVQAAAHERSEDPSHQYETGQVTGLSIRTISINGREFALHPKVVIRDDEGRPRQLQDFKPDSVVQYQLKDDLIRQLILVPTR
jgi:hypothetical protein